MTHPCPRLPFPPPISPLLLPLAPRSLLSRTRSQRLRPVPCPILTRSPPRLLPPPSELLRPRSILNTQSSTMFPLREPLPPHFRYILRPRSIPNTQSSTMFPLREPLPPHSRCILHPRSILKTRSCPHLSPRSDLQLIKPHMRRNGSSCWLRRRGIGSCWLRSGRISIRRTSMTRCPRVFSRHRCTS